MSSSEDYRATTVKAASAAIVRGHHDPANLRELLVWTTSKTTRAMVEEYFRKHFDDRVLLEMLCAIAEEGEDCGDAPWAAANTISEFPVALLMSQRTFLCGPYRATGGACCHGNGESGATSGTELCGRSASSMCSSSAPFAFGNSPKTQPKNPRPRKQRFPNLT